MKVLSIRQPYPWLIFNGGKSIENRSWATSYTGPLLIHAGKALYPDAERIRDWWNNLVSTDITGKYPQMPLLDDLPKGAIVGVAELAGCRWMNCETA
ncbi:MAG: ASCH domain-containing protein, partial [Hyphomicrobium sp.]